MKYCFKINLIIFFIVGIQIISQAQLIVKNQVNLELLNDFSTEIQLVSLSENGVVIINNKKNLFGKKNNIEFIKYDSTLTEVWKQTYEPSINFNVSHTLLKDNFIYYYFQEASEQLFFIIRVNVTDGQIVVNEGSLLTRMDVDFFEIVGSKALLGGSYNDRAVVELFNFVEKTGRVLSGLYSNNLKVQGINELPNVNEFIVLIRNVKKCLVYVYTFNYEGKLLNNYLLGDKNQVPLSGNVLKIKNEELVLVGNYSDNCSTYSTGFFVHNLTKNLKTEYYDFTSLDNYLNYLPEKRRLKLLSKISTKKEKGKNYKIRNRIYLHKPTLAPDGWVMVAEIYFPEYNSESSNYFMSYRMYRIDNQYFNRFNYSHAFVGKFDNEGKMTWNNSFSLKNIKTFELNEISQITPANGGYLFAYPDDGVIKTGIINNDNQVKEFGSYDIKNLDQTEKVVDINSSNLLAWYGHSFLVYGNKRVLNPSGEGFKERFFIRKLTYDPSAITSSN